MRILCMAVVAVLLLGCKPADQGGSGGGQQGAGIIDTMTQKSKVDAGKRAAQQVRDIGEQQQQDLNEVMGQ